MFPFHAFFFMFPFYFIFRFVFILSVSSLFFPFFVSFLFLHSFMFLFYFFLSLCYFSIFFLFNLYWQRISRSALSCVEAKVSGQMIICRRVMVTKLVSRFIACGVNLLYIACQILIFFWCQTSPNASSNPTRCYFLLHDFERHEKK